MIYIAEKNNSEFYSNSQRISSADNEEFPMYNHNHLPKELNSDNLSLETLKSLQEGMENAMKRKEILSNHRPAIKQLPNGKWYTRLNGRKLERVNKKDLEDLIVKAYTIKPHTIASIFNNYLDRRKKDVADTTWQKDIRYFELYIKGSEQAEIPLDKLTLDDGYRFLDHCLAVNTNMKRKYWNNIKGFLNNLFQYAMDQNLIEKNPFQKLKPKKDLFAPPKKTRDGDTVFSQDEQFKVCALAEDDAVTRNKSEPLGIILLFNLGIRDGELCALKWGDIELSVKKQNIFISSAKWSQV